MSIDISDKNIRNREKNFLPPAFSKNGHERAGSHPGELFSRTGRTYYGFQILIRSKEEKEEDDDDDTWSDDEDDISSNAETSHTLENMKFSDAREFQDGLAFVRIHGKGESYKGFLVK